MRTLNIKSDLVNRFRDVINKQLISTSPNPNKQVAALHSAINADRDRFILEAKANACSNESILPIVLHAYYASFIAMLEGRNSIRPYEYMDFSRRVGEFWETICARCFFLPTRTDVSMYVPPSFKDLETYHFQEITKFVHSLNISQIDRDRLFRYYNQIWRLITSGSVNLTTDSHVAISSKRYVIDFKSGFGSNEKGNTNRLLLIASMYRNIAPDDYSCLLLVRTDEHHNNGYLKVLRESNLWDVKCSSDAYEEIRKITGFDIRNWISENVNWEQDLDNATTNHLRDKNLLQYVKW